MERLKQSRPRPQLSCTPCRSRKLKCDRLSPCSQCIKGSRLDECVIPDEAGNVTGGRPTKRSRQSTEELSQHFASNGREQSLSSTGSRGSVPRIRQAAVSQTSTADPTISDLQVRIKALEDAVFASARTQVGSLEAQNLTTQLSGHESLSVEGSRVRYQGGMHRFALVEQFNHVRSYIPKAFRNPEIAKAMKLLSTTQKARCVKLNVNRREVFSNHDELKAKVLDLMPQYHICMQLMEAYLTHWEGLYRIVITVRTRIRYSASWPSEKPSHLHLPYLLMLLLMVAIGDHTTDTEPILEPDCANHACSLVQSYLDTCSPKAKQEIETIQVWVLMILTHQVYLVATPKIWLQTGNLVRHAMAMGLHRDPSESKHITLFCCELRRRLWATILEFDIQASLIYGMPMAISQADISCQPPSNIAEDEMEHDNSALPEAGLETQWTQTLPQILLAKSAPLRMRVVQLLPSRSVHSCWNEAYMICTELKDTHFKSADHGSGAWPFYAEVNQLKLSHSLYELCHWQVLLQLYHALYETAPPLQKMKIQKELMSIAFDIVNRQKSLPCCPHSSSHPCQYWPEGSTTSYRVLSVLSRRTFLQALLVLLGKDYAPETSHAVDEHGGLGVAYNCTEDQETAIYLGRHILVQWLPHGDPKDALLMTLAGESATWPFSSEEWVHGKMQLTILEVIADCQKKLESVPPRRIHRVANTKSSDHLAHRPGSANKAPTDDVLGPVEDLSFADLGFGFMDDWQDGLQWME